MKKNVKNNNCKVVKINLYIYNTKKVKNNYNKFLALQKFREEKKYVNKFSFCKDTLTSIYCFTEKTNSVTPFFYIEI